MTQSTYQLPLTFEQILALVRQLSPSEQAHLIQELTPKNERHPRQYRTQAFKALMMQVQPVPSDFDPEEAKENYLTEKYNR